MEIIVLGNGYGGIAVADFLQEELSVMAINSVDIRNYMEDRAGEPSREQIIIAIRKSLKPYLGKANLFVLGNFLQPSVLDKLRKLYPQENFVGMSFDYKKLRRLKRHGLLVLSGTNSLKPFIQQDLSSHLPMMQMAIPNLESWNRLVDHRALSRRAISQKLSKYIASESPERYREQMLVSESPNQWREKLPIHVVIRLARLAKNSSPPRRSLATNTTECLPATRICESEVPFRIGAILILDTHFWMIEPELRKIFGRRLPILDFREKLLHDVCLALRLRGVDGKLGE